MQEYDPNNVWSVTPEQQKINKINNELKILNEKHHQTKIKTRQIKIKLLNDLIKIKNEIYSTRVNIHLSLQNYEKLVLQQAKLLELDLKSEFDDNDSIVEVETKEEAMEEHIQILQKQMEQKKPVPVIEKEQQKELEQIKMDQITVRYD